MAFSQLRHAGFLVEDVAKAAEWYGSAFGIGPFRTWDVSFFDVRLRGGEPDTFTTRIGIARVGDTELELVQSRLLSGRSAFFDEVKQSRGGCMHHLAFTVDDLDEAVAGLETAGATVLVEGKFGGGRFAYLDSEEKAGILYELMEMAPRQPRKSREQ